MEKCALYYYYLKRSLRTWSAFLSAAVRIADLVVLRVCAPSRAHCEQEEGPQVETQVLQLSLLALPVAVLATLLLLDALLLFMDWSLEEAWLLTVDWSLEEAWLLTVYCALEEA